MTEKYLFIDGAFLQGYIREMKSLIEPEFGEININISNLGIGYSRIFYYDAYPEWDATTDPDKTIFNREMEEAEQRFSEISMMRNFHVRPALTRRGKKREQKGVDVLLAIECLMHSMRGNIDEAVIMTSDLDFFPLFEALLQTKTKSWLLFDRHRTAQDLLSAADTAVPLNVDDFLSWVVDAPHLKKVYPYSNDVLENFKTVKVGRFGDQEVELKQSPHQDFYVCVQSGKGVGQGRALQCIAELQFEEVRGGRISFE